MVELLKENGLRAMLCIALMIMGLAAMRFHADVVKQADRGNKNLPVAYYIHEGPPYFPMSPRMKLSREAAAQKAYNEEMASRQSQEATE
ncbi:MAG: hypothetical protein SGJ20_14295 [Planctomycetota bacterium]|nr:hypothetical protein [Planctomycetota bacterium]